MTGRLTIRPLRADAGSRECETWLRDVVTQLGGGFHPDTPGKQYVDRQHQPSFSAEDAAAYDEGLARCFDVGLDVYEIGLAIIASLDTLRNRIVEAQQRHGRRLADFGFVLRQSGPHGYEVQHETAESGCGWSGDFHPDVERTICIFLTGVEQGTALARRGIAVTTSGDRYSAAMAEAARTWADVIEALHAAGFDEAEVTQTGGMCLAIEVPMGDKFVLITDFEDVLPWDRTMHAGWTVGVYDKAEVEHEGFTENHDEVYCAEGTDAAPMITALVAYRDGRAG